MITVQRENDDVIFFNENEYINFVYSKEQRKFVACTKQDTANVEVNDVVCVTYTNNAHPTSQTFQADKKQAAPTAYDEQPVTVLYEEIDRLDEIEKKQKQKEYKERYPQSRHRSQKSGMAFRFLSVCRHEDIETVGQIVRMGYSRFLRLNNIGHNCAEKVREALDNLYGIKW